MARPRLDAQQLLRSHVIERHNRAAIKAQDIAGDPDSTPRMSLEQWVDSCGLVRGVAAVTLGLLHTLWCESPGTEVQTVIVELDGGGEVEVQQRVVARRYTLTQAAQRCGLSAVEAQRRLSEACEVVSDNMLRRMPRGEAA